MDYQTDPGDATIGISKDFQTDPGDAAIGSSKDAKKELYNPRGEPSVFAKGSYAVNQHVYPSDLMGPLGEYGGNYVIFYINVATDSKLFSSGENVETVGDFPPRDRGPLIGQNMTGGRSAGVLGGQLVGATAVANTIKGFIGGSIGFGGNTKTEKVASAVKGIGIANIATVGVGFASQMAPDATRSQKRLKTAIAMHVPNQLSIRYGMNWSEEDTFALAAGATGIQEITKALNAGAKLKDLKNLGTPAQAIIANIALSNSNPGVGAALGLAANPRKEQVFKGVDFRTFSFDYQFFPRDVTEAQNVLNIIKEFKYHMHPEFKDDNNFVYIYPSEFDIFYYQGGVENPNLHRHTSCVLTEMNVNYTPNGNFTTFPNGMPTQINVTLAFRELSLLTKDKVKDGL